MIRLRNKKDIFALRKLSDFHPEALPAETRHYIPAGNEITEAWDENGCGWHARWFNGELWKVPSFRL
jgi:hypothetical protein